VEKCGIGVGLEFGLGFELWEWGCEEELFESFFPEFPEFQFSLGLISLHPMDVICFLSLKMHISKFSMFTTLHDLCVC